MTENKNDKHPRQSAGNPGQQPAQPTSDKDINKTKVKAPEAEEWDVVNTDQRRPQFRCSENNGRRFF